MWIGAQEAFLLSEDLGVRLICHNVIHVIYVTWAGVICLRCTHEPEGVQHPRVSVDILGKSLLPMLHMLCNTSGIQKITLHYIGKDGTFDYDI